jgi:peptidoglycan hydrolase-like protein with peptidoglycan-binding domain
VTRRRTIAALVLALAAAGVALLLVDPFGGRGNARQGVSDNAYPTALARVTRRSLASRTSVNGTLEYAGSYSVVNQASGTATWLPHVGQTIRRGGVLYRADGKPVMLLYGRIPAFRELKEGRVGRDVRQLNANLAELGYAVDPSSAQFTAATAYALERLQDALGLRATGKLALGQAVFLPRPLRITKVMATLGARLAPGGVVAQASSTTRRVRVNLDAAQQTSVRFGNRVRITLPDNRTTSGIVTSVGSVATADRKIPVFIAPRSTKALGKLDQAPVQVQITTASVKHALVVPVDALLAVAGGGYSVEVVNADGVHRLVPVTPGLFDDADGLVQVSGAGLSAGQRIVVPSS